MEVILMKKLISLMLVAMMALCLIATAETAIPSPTLDMDFTWEFETPDVEGADSFFFAVSEDEDDIAACKDELAALAEAETAADFFGDAAEEALAITGGEELTPCEFAPVICGNYKEELGSVALNVTAPTQYEEGQAVVALFEIGGEWSVFSATGNADGNVALTLDSDTLLAIQESGAMMVLAI
ncbi:MAG: hypothetical protein II875_08230 [Clostridia bacterium]|nr:hypothetical protein [Clostridia bacterium]